MPPPPLLACFAHERGDARVRKRVAAFQALGWTVHGYMFHRVRDREDAVPFWVNVELGVTENRQYLKRIRVLFGSLRILWSNRERLRGVKAYYAVNSDNALLALAARWISSSRQARPPVVLELADLQPAMLGTGLRSRLLRTLERQVLRRTSLLVTTSPGFVREYFTPLQRYAGPVFLLENKVFPSTGLVPPGDPGEVPPAPVRRAKPWVIGLFGALRCPRSLDLMARLAGRFPDLVCFALRGYPSHLSETARATLLGGTPGLEWGGAYHYPENLAEIYGGIDFNWTFDFSDPSGNSSWLLPNRIYEGGLFACPALADATTETGRWVAAHGAGWIFSEPLEESLAAFFTSLTVADWQEKKSACARFPRSLTCGEDDYRALSDTIIALAGVPPLP